MSQALFEEGNRYLLQNEFEKAIETYEAFRKEQTHVAVTHNLAIAYAFSGEAERAIELLEGNMKSEPKYGRSFVFAAEVHRRAARGQDWGAAAGLIQKASEMLKTALEIDVNDVQTCIVASEILAACKGSEGVCVDWHKRALGAARARGSKISPHFVAVYMDNMADEAIHYFSSPPEEPVIAGSLPPLAREQGRVLVLIGQDTEVGNAFRDWPLLRVTYGPGPKGTAEGHMHVRTLFQWAAIFRAAQAVLDQEIAVAVVGCHSPDPRIVETQALITLEDSNRPLDAFCLRPASLQELEILRQLYNPATVPPVNPSEEMAAAAWSHLSKDSALDVESLEDGDEKQGGDEEAAEVAPEV